MLSPGQYISQHGISPRTFRRRKAEGKLTLLYNDKGEQFVADDNEVEKIRMDKKTLKVLIDNIKDGYNLKILKAAADPSKKGATVKEILSDVESWKLKGVEIYGYGQRSIYDKIEICETNDFSMNKNPLARAERCDKHVVFKNPQLAKQEVREKIAWLFAKFYFENGTGSVRASRILVHEYSKKDIDFIEIASIPPTTLHDFIEKKCKNLSLKQIHLLYNNYNKFRARQIYNEGAFTNDINFMEWWMIDDHVEEISGAQYYNQVTGQTEIKKVYTWGIMEAFTLEEIAWEQKAEPFTARDIKLLIIKALMSRGKPIKGILMDNGLAASNMCREMLTQLKVNFDPGPAYEPLHKAVRELSWKFLKQEFNANRKNYIGGNRKEVRHSNKKLSPETPDYFVDEYMADFDTYMEGWRRNKPRERTIKFKKQTMSIAEHFEQCYKSYQCNMIRRQELAFAAQEKKIRKMNHYYINMGTGMGVYDGQTDHMLPIYNDKKYMCFYNPVDTNVIDCYTLEAFMDETTGEQAKKGDYVFSLYSQRHKGTPERQANVSKSRKTYEKQLRQMKKAVVNNELTKNINALSPELNEKGKFIDRRVELNEYADDLVKERMENVGNLIADKINEKTAKPGSIKAPEVEYNELNAEDELEAWL